MKGSASGVRSSSGSGRPPQVPAGGGDFDNMVNMTVNPIANEAAMAAAAAPDTRGQYNQHLAPPSKAAVQGGGGGMTSAYPISVTDSDGGASDGKASGGGGGYRPPPSQQRGASYYPTHGGPTSAHSAGRGGVNGTQQQQQQQTSRGRGSSGSGRGRMSAYEATEEV